MAPGIVVGRRGRLALVLGLTIRHENMVAVDVMAAPRRLRQLHLAVLDR